MQARAIIFGTGPGDHYRAGRTRRSLVAAGFGPEDIGERTGDLAPILRAGGPLLLLRAGTWLVQAERFGFPRSSATGRGLCALGAVRAPEECGPGVLETAAAWQRWLAATGGDFSRRSSGFEKGGERNEPGLPKPSALFLDEIATNLLATAGASSLEEIVEQALPNLRVVHFAPLDVHDDEGFRALQIITSLQRGGAERMTLDLMAGLPAQGVRTRLVTLGRSLREAFPSPPGTVELAKLVLDPESRGRELARIARGFGADLIHGHLITGADARRVSGAGFPVLVTVHNMRAGWPKGLGELRAGDVSLLAACANVVGEELAEHPVTVRTVWNGINWCDFRSTPGRVAAGRVWRRQWGFAEGDLVLVAVANPRPQKRLHRLPAILAAVRRKLGASVEARLVFCGEAMPGNPEAEGCVEETLAEVSRLGLDPHVRWTGPVADVAGVLAAADVLVSTSAHEGLSLAQLEAAAAGCAVVASDVGGAREIARTCPHFYLVPPDAPAEEFAKEVVACIPAGKEHGPVSPSSMDRSLAENEPDAFAGSRGRGSPAASPIIRQDFDGRAGLRSAGTRAPGWSREEMAARYAWLYPRAMAAAQRKGAGKGVWLITNNFSTGGAQSSARRLLLGLAAAGERVRAAVVEELPGNPTPGRRALLEAGIVVVSIPPAQTQTDLQAALQQLLAVIDSDLPGAVVFWNLRPGHKVLLADALLDVPVFDVSPGEMFFDSLESYFARTHGALPYHTPRDYGARLAGVIVKYEAEARRAADALGAPVYVVPNGVPLPELEEEARPREPRPTIVFGTAARINPQKRLEDLLAAFRLAHHRMSPCALRIAGGVERGCSEYAARLRVMAEGLPVEWLGETLEMAAFHRSLDVFVMISEPAGCPNASLEAMAAGLPVIATDVGGASEQVLHGRTGLLIPPRNPEALAEALVEMRAQAGLRQSMGNAARDRIRERFSLEGMIANYRRIFRGSDSRLP